MHKQESLDTLDRLMKVDLCNMLYNIGIVRQGACERNKV
jgi:hypothetical protein